MHQSTDIPLVLFAKAPIAGKVKTRLQSHCSAEQAARIAELLLEAALEKVCLSWPGPVFLSTFLNADHPALRHLSEKFGVALHEQVSGDLGKKMLCAFEYFGYPTAIMGADAPHVTNETLLSLHGLLNTGESAIGPSMDGGYYIIGLSQSAPEIFWSIDWGKERVLEQTLIRAANSNLRLNHLHALNDIDEWQDLVGALRQLPAIEAFLKDQRLVY